MWIRFYKILFAVILVSFLFACSTNRLAYNYLDWVITWHIDGYVKLSSQQDDYFNRQLNELLQWHRSDQLLHYAAFIDKMIPYINQSVDIDLLLERKKVMREFMHVFIERAAPDGIKLLLWLDPDQRQELYEVCAKKQKKLEKKYLNEPKSKRSKRIYKRMVKLLKRFIGRLTDEQKNTVTLWADSLVPVTTLWLENRQKMLDRLETVLEGSGTDTNKYKHLYQHLVKPESQWSKTYSRAVQENEIYTLEMFVNIHNSMNEKQREHLYDVLSRLKNDFEYLARE